MTEYELKKRYPNASRAFLAANADVDHPRPDAQPEPYSRSESVAADQDQKGAAGKLHLRLVSVRKRLCDPDNLFPKYLVDSLRYSRFIPGDEPEKITVEVTQRKAKEGEMEHTVLTILKHET